MSFLRKLASKNGGTARQIYVARDAPSQLEDFFLTMSSPLLKDVSFSFDYSQVDQHSLTSYKENTYFEGSELVVAGKLLSNKASEVSGTVFGYWKDDNLFTSHITASASDPSQPGQLNSERLWAFLKTKQLLRSAMFDADEEAANATITVALSDSFDTPYTCLSMDFGEDEAETSTAAPLAVKPSAIQ